MQKSNCHFKRNYPNWFHTTAELVEPRIDIFAMKATRSISECYCRHVFLSDVVNLICYASGTIRNTEKSCEPFWFTFSSTWPTCIHNPRSSSDIPNLQNFFGRQISLTGLWPVFVKFGSNWCFSGKSATPARRFMPKHSKHSTGILPLTDVWEATNVYADRFSAIRFEMKIGFLALHSLAQKKVAFG